MLDLDRGAGWVNAVHIPRVTVACALPARATPRDEIRLQARVGFADKGPWEKLHAIGAGKGRNGIAPLRDMTTRD